jgi:hypothetical protein
MEAGGRVDVGWYPVILWATRRGKKSKLKPTKRES